MTCSLRRPPRELTLVHRLLWPLIFAQLVALKNQVRARYGRGVPYGYFVSRWGRVTLTYVGAQPFTSYSADGSISPVLCTAARAVCARLMRALAADDSVPVVPVRALLIHSVHVHSDTPLHDSP